MDELIVGKIKLSPHSLPFGIVLNPEPPVDDRLILERLDTIEKKLDRLLMMEDDDEDLELKPFFLNCPQCKKSFPTLTLAAECCLHPKEDKDV